MWSQTWGKVISDTCHMHFNRYYILTLEHFRLAEMKAIKSYPKICKTA